MAGESRLVSLTRINRRGETSRWWLTEHSARSLTQRYVQMARLGGLDAEYAWCGDRTGGECRNCIGARWHDQRYARHSVAGFPHRAAHPGGPARDRRTRSGRSASAAPTTPAGRARCRAPAPCTCCRGTPGGARESPGGGRAPGAGECAEARTSGTRRATRQSSRAGAAPTRPGAAAAATACPATHRPPTRINHTRSQHQVTDQEYRAM